MIATMTAKRPVRVLGAFFAAVVLFLLYAAPSQAAQQWRIDSLSKSTAQPGGTIVFQAQATNVGDAPTDGSTISVTAQLPTGFTVGEPEKVTLFEANSGITSPCMRGDGSPLTGGETEVKCETTSVVPSQPEGHGLIWLNLHLPVAVSPLATLGSHAIASFGVEGGGAPAATTVDPVLIAPISPPFGIDVLDGQIADRNGNPHTQAGGHPHVVSTQLDFNTRTVEGEPLKGEPFPVEPVADIVADLPRGLVGVPGVVDQCTLGQLAVGVVSTAAPLCPATSQVGTTTVKLRGVPTLPNFFGPFPIFNMVPPSSAPARFGINVYGTIVLLDASVRSDGDYGLTVAARNVPETLALAGTTLEFWGVPADPSHDPERNCPGSSVPVGTDVSDPGCVDSSGHPRYVRPPLRAFLRTPTSCSGPGGLATRVHIDSWDNPGRELIDGAPDLSDPRWKSGSFSPHEAPAYPFPEEAWGPRVGATGCSEVPFEPTLAVETTSHSADSASGLVVDIAVPQEKLVDPGEVAQSDLKDAVVTLPEGFAVNPASASGLGACTAAEIRLGSTAEPDCPDSSKIGSVEIETPLLVKRNADTSPQTDPLTGQPIPDPLRGAVYLAKQGDNPFGSLLALYLVAEGHGVIVKLAGRVETGPTGRLTTRFLNQPQLPFSKLHLQLKGGDRAPLRTPVSCGAYLATAELTPWSGNPAAELSSSLPITTGANGAPCPGSGGRSFAPKFDAGTVNPIAGSFSPFVLDLSREDGSKELIGIDATLPPGLLGKLKGIPYCADAALASIPVGEASLGRGAAQFSAPSCPSASQIGTVVAGAGAGTPFLLDTGRVYLAGPYKGAPLSIAVVTPALAGPFDLGNVLVRAALHLDPVTTRLRAISDPWPTILHGIPLDIRSIHLQIDRPGFTLNPTSCDPMEISGAISGVEDAKAEVSSRFQVTNCAGLSFRPRLSLRLRGGAKRSDHPALRATLKMPKGGGANIARASVALPHSVFLAQSHIRTICTRVQFAADACPKGSVYGHARAFSPLLDKPLEGPVYLRSSRNPLPDLVAALDGQIEVELVGRIDSKNGGIRTTFAHVPDAPVSKFVLSMKGGRKGLIENSRNLCRSPSRATVLMNAHNGKLGDSRPLLRATCRGRDRGRR